MLLVAGKTFTMEGVSDKEKPELRGIMLNVFDFIFDQIQEENRDQEYLVYASYLEIYNEEIKDLLAKDTSKKLQLKEGKDKGVYVNGLSKVHCMKPASPGVCAHRPPIAPILLMYHAESSQERIGHAAVPCSRQSQPACRVHCNECRIFTISFYLHNICRMQANWPFR
jgi:hypothetical protein